MSNLPLIGSSPSQGSPFGLSYWSRFAGMGCPKRAELDKSSGLGYDGDSIHSDPLSVGSIFHKITEHWRKDELAQIVLDNSNPSVPEAARLAKGYREHYKKDEFGQTLTEFPLMFGCSDCFLGKHQSVNCLKSTECMDMFGVPVISGKIDLVCNPSAAHVEALQNAPRFLPVAEPGFYLLDYKTMRAKPGDTTEIRERFQFILYQILWDIQYGHTHGPCKGFIVDCIVKHKKLIDGSFFSLLIPPPDRDRYLALKTYLTSCYKNRVNYGETYANPAACFSYGNPCVHFSSGACARHD